MSQPQSPESKILIVEDDPGVRGSLDILFQVYGLKVTWAVHAHNALDIVKASPGHYELVLVDGRLPDIHGQDLIPMMREFLPKKVRIYLFTGEVFTPSPEDMARMGIDGLIEKPFNFQALIELLKTA